VLVFTSMEAKFDIKNEHGHWLVYQDEYETVWMRPTGDMYSVHKKPMMTVVLPPLVAQAPTNCAGLVQGHVANDTKASK